MDLFALYSLIANWAGWPVVIAGILLVGAFGFWSLNNRITGLKENNEFLINRIHDLENFTPDVIANRLLQRYRFLSEELERMEVNEEADRQLIESKESELEATKQNISILQEQLDTAQTTLESLSNEFTCPHCGSYLETHIYYPMSMEDSEGRDIDFDIEETSFQCGFAMRDGVEISPCGHKTASEANDLPFR